ncbi:MAG: hypothetical protein DWQ09_14250 [Proteobacteria bacterium]|nr:MAG: hypothetical protein DWQ09_14250 [Pseudomonadota bacterium]QKK10426.1 MAG: hypothetical protein HND59_01140 [Pseudomonadota bacterium]
MDLKQSWITGLSFGLTSGVITTLGLMVGLHSGTHSTLAVAGGVITIAIADACSDALGIHVAEESRATRNTLAIWEATIATLITKMAVALTFLVPIFLFELSTAIVVAVVWGLLLLTVLSWRLARHRGESALPVVGEHLLIAVVVIVATHYVGDWVAIAFA